MAAVNIGPGDALADRSKVKARLLCIPPAGMGAWAFHGYQRALHPTVELLPVELPGRNTRASEPRPHEMTALASALAEELHALGALELPYLLFGHSLGALLAFELAAQLAQRGRRLPTLLLVSGARPPHLAAPEHDADQLAPALGGLPPDEFWRHFVRRYGELPPLRDAAVRRAVLPSLQADFALLEAYAPSRRRAPCAVLACGAAGDARLSPGQLAQWEAAAGEGGEGVPAFRMVEFEVRPSEGATAHRYVVDDAAPLQRLLAAEAEALVAALGGAEGGGGAAAGGGKGVVPAVSVEELLAEAGCSAYAGAAACASVRAWCELSDQGRPALLNELKAVGVQKLTERQAIANALGRARRAAAT